MLIKNLISNAAILFCFLFFCGRVFRKNENGPKTTLLKEIKVGVIAGLFGIFLMFFSVKIPPNILLDLRVFTVIIIAMYDGFAAPIAAAMLISIFRMSYFGINETSVLYVSLLIPFSFGCGYICRLKIKEETKWIWMNIIGIVLIDIVLYQTSLNREQVIQTILVYSVISLLVARVIYYYLQIVILSNKLFSKYENESKVAENLTDLISVHKMNGVITYVSPSSYKLLGYTPEELLGRNAYEYIYDEDVNKVQIQHTFLNQSNKPITGEFRMKTKEKDLKWVEATVRKIEEDHKKNEYIICVSRDITERKNMEIAMNKSNEQKIDILESIQDAFFALDNNSCFTYINKATEELFKKKRTQIIGKNIWDIFPDAKDSGFHTVYKEILDKKIKISQEEYLPQTEKWFNITAFPTREGVSVYFKDVTARKIAEEKLKAISFLDGLTQIPNRRYFNDKINEEWNRCIRDKKPLSVFMLDVDHFKAYNDTYGHQEGDECLKTVAKIMSTTVNRSYDMVARYGGEEFVAVLPDTDKAGAIYVADKLRKAIEDLLIPNVNSLVKPTVTVSIGVSTVVPVAEGSYENLINNADKALYEAKNEGRNRVKFNP